jgi:hypothetical protein
MVVLPLVLAVTVVAVQVGQATQVKAMQVQTD